MEQIKKIAYKLSVIILIVIIPFVSFALIITILRLIYSYNSYLPEFIDTIFIKNNDYLFDLNNVFTFSIAVTQVIITTIFSYFLLKTSEESNRISNQLKIKEESRDNEIIRENALIVYYDLLLGIKDIFKLYKSMKLEQKESIPKRLYFSNDWIKNVAVLKDGLRKEEINKVYSLYGQLHTVKDFLANGNSSGNKELLSEIEQIYNEVFMLDEKLINFENINDINCTSLLELNYRIIFDKLMILAVQKYDKGINKNDYGQYDIEYKDNIIGNENIFTNNGLEEFIRYEYYPNGDIWIEIEYNNQQLEMVTIFTDANTVLFKGKIKNKKIVSGKGKIFDKEGRVKMEGEWDKGEFKEGIIYNKLVETYDGLSFINGDFDMYIEQQERNEEFYKQQLAQNAEGFNTYANVRVVDNKYSILEDTREEIPVKDGRELY